MRLDFSDERVLAVVAHPDDAELYCGGTLARARDDGAVIGICVLCQGDKGRPADPISDLPVVRRIETQAAASLLDADLMMAGREDGALANTAEIRRWMIEQFRQFRPTLVLAHSPDDYHPDHRMASELAEAVSWYCSSHGQETESPVLDRQPAVWWMDTMEAIGPEPHFYVDVSDYKELKRRLLACHQSQLQRGGDADFSPLVEMMERQNRFRGNQAGVDAAEAFRTHSAWKRIAAW